MSDEFKVDSKGFTFDGYRSLEPSSLKSMYLGNLLVLSVLVCLASLAYLFSHELFDVYAGIIKTVAIAILGLACIYLFLGPQVFFRRYRYRIDDDKLEIRKGIFVISHKLIPVERIHQVEVSRGPINRMFGLANVNITTAGGTAVLQYLSEDVAEGVAERLNQYVVTILKERE